MGPFSTRAFSFGFVLFTFAVLVSSATDDNSKLPGAASTVVGTGTASTSNAQQTPGGETSKTNVTLAKKPSENVHSVSTNCSVASNGTDCPDDRSIVTKFWDKMTENRDMLFRTMYVLLGVTSIVIVYFLVRAFRLRRRRNKSRKYGVITTRGDVEMEPLGQGEDEDEDYTVFELNGRRK